MESGLLGGEAVADDVPPPCAAGGLSATDVLRVPYRKRVSLEYTTSESGERELNLFYGIHVVTFDEARLFAFAEQLIAQTAFVAGTATAWGPGYEWSELRELFTTLLELGIVKHDDGVEDVRGTGPVAPLLPATGRSEVRTWSAATCEAITRELGGRAVELGYIEAFVFTFRLAHSAIDGDGRQVGEANVYPARLRVDQDTEWRVCQYAGSRYRDHAPMNVTALKAMIKYWKPMMITLLATRAEVQRRLPRAAASWTVGDLHTLANVVLTLPAYVLLKHGGQVPQVPIDPVLSSLFRITDGVRMVTHEMLLMSDGSGRLPDHRTSATEIFEFAEQRGLLMTDTGVCSGPKAMIDDFLAIVCDGTPVDPEGCTLPPQVQALLDELPAAVDYGLYALQIWTVVRSAWPAMTAASDAVRAQLAGAEDAGARLRERLAEDRERLDRAHVGPTDDASSHRTHVDAYAHAWRGLRQPVGPATLDACVAPRAADASHAAAADQLRALLGQRLALANDALDALTAAAIDFLRVEQAVLAATTALAATINERLVRPHPTRPLTMRDCRIAFILRDDHLSDFPYLFDAFEDVLGIAVEATQDHIQITDRHAQPQPRKGDIQ